MNAYLNIPLIYVLLSLGLIFSEAYLNKAKNCVYLNLLVKPRFFQVFSKNINLCSLIGEKPFKMHKKNQKKITKKLCVSTLPKFFRHFTLHETHLVFIWPYHLGIVTKNLSSGGYDHLSAQR